MNDVQQHQNIIHPNGLLHKNLKKHQQVIQILFILINFFDFLLEELTALPSLVTLPTLISSQVTTNNTKPSISNSGEVTMLGKLSEAMNKLIHKQGDTNGKLNLFFSLK